MKSEKLETILAAHLVWLETEGRDGTRANLYRANLYHGSVVGTVTRATGDTIAASPQSSQGNRVAFTIEV